MTLGDGTEIGHPQIIRDGDADKMVVHFERPTQDGFASARCEPPSYTWTPRETRLSDSDRSPFEELLRSNAHLPYRYAATATGHRTCSDYARVTVVANWQLTGSRRQATRQATVSKTASKTVSKSDKFRQATADSYQTPRVHFGSFGICDHNPGYVS